MLKRGTHDLPQILYSGAAQTPRGNSFWRCCGGQIYHGLLPDNTVHLSYNCYQLIFILFQPNFRLLELIFPQYFLHTFNFVHKLQYLIFRAFLATNFFSSPRKVGPHAQQQPVHRFPSHQQPINPDNQQKLQSPPNKASSLNNN